MKHLIDSREPITTTDIDKAVEDASTYLNRSGAVDPEDLIARLQAIVCDAYGYDE